jgi:hypothetical protein
MDNLFKTAAGYKWWPDADSVAAPDWALLRADNLVPDPEGVLSLRAGSNTLYTGLGTRVSALYSCLLSGSRKRYADVDKRLFIDGVDSGSTFDTPLGTSDNDVAMGDDSYQAFFAHGATKKKHDGTTLNEWGIRAPEFAPALQAVTAITATVASFDSTESPAFTVNEGTSAFVEGHSGAANGALRLTPKLETGRASASVKYAAAKDFLNIGGSQGSDTDLFDLYIWMEDPREVDKVTIMFGLENATDPFKNDYYYFDFKVKDAGTVDTKDPAAAAAAAYATLTSKLHAPLTVNEITRVKTPAEARAVVTRSPGRFLGARATERRDSLAASPAWTHFSVTRGLFNRVGGTASRNWTTVWAFKVVYSATPLSTKVIYFDDAVWTGGGNRSLTGRFRVGLRFVRNFQDGTYYEKSPIGPISDEITLSQQSLQVTVSAATLAGKDPQVNEIWVYLYGGFLDTFYRVAVVSAFVNQGMTIDDLTNPVGSNFDSALERVRLTSHGFTLISGTSSSLNLVFTINKSELEAIIENEVLTPGIVGPPDNIVAIAGPWNRRMFALTQDGYLYMSQQNDPAGFSLYHSVLAGDLRQYGTPKWMVKTGTGIYVGMSKDIIQMAGSGDEDESKVTIDLSQQPLNIGNPPVDPSVETDGNAVVFRSVDGPMVLTGSSLQPIPAYGTTLLWRGQSRHGVDALNIAAGRFRFAEDNHILFMLASEGTDTDPTSVWRYDLTDASPQWSRTTYSQSFLSIFKDPDGHLLVGTSDGKIIELEVGIQDTDENGAGQDIEVLLRTPISDGGRPLNRKDAVDLQVHCDTGSSMGNINMYKDGSGSVSTTVPFSTTIPTVYRSSVTGLGTFLKAQMEITGSFFRFVLQAFNLTYRPRPQQVMALDCGYILPREPRDMTWMVEVEIDCSSPANLELDIYREDVLHATVPVTVTPNVRDNYRISVPKGSKARRLRLFFRTLNGPGSNNPGFEPWGVRIRERSSGNESELGFRTIYPVGQAP